MTGLSHTLAGANEVVSWCVCGWYSTESDAVVGRNVTIRELAEHVSQARRGERAAATASRYDAEADLAAVRRITAGGWR